MFEQIINRVQSAIIKERPFVVYRKPQDEFITIIIQNDDELIYSKHLNETGFVFSPFNNKEETIIFKKEDSTEKTIQYKTENLNFQADFQSFIVENDEKNKYVDLVNRTVQFIENNDVEKIVTSRKQFVSLSNTTFELKLLSYIRLLNTYPEAFVYWWNHPKVGNWMGASPEKLLALSNGKLLTMSLAGTQLYSQNITWSEKEIDEQAIVTQFITKQLQAYCEDIQISATFTKKSGHLAHLCTLLEGNIKPKFQLKSFVEKMHPTPAVCGNPKNIAKKFILQNEGYDRKFYTGFLGKIDSINDADLFVNLRCMEWMDNGINIFVGGGITKSSVPEDEWEETVNKSQVMLKVLNL